MIVVSLEAETGGIPPLGLELLGSITTLEKAKNGILSETWIETSHTFLSQPNKVWTRPGILSLFFFLTVLVWTLSFLRLLIIIFQI